MVINGPNRRDHRRVERGEVRRAEFLDPGQAGATLGDEAAGVETEAAGGEAGRLLDAVGEEEDGAAVVAPPRVVEADADLEDALVEAADLAPLGVPLVLDHLVALV